jgi:hypothetical protein
MDYPEDRSAGDAAHVTARAVLSAVPVVGGAAVELMAAVLTPPLDRRRAEFFREVGERLARLEQEDRLRIEDLGTNEAFIDTVLQATVCALRTKAGMKRDAFRNVILNSALNRQPQDAINHVLLGLVDRLTEPHIRILAAAAQPMAWIREHGIELRRGSSGMPPRDNPETIPRVARILFPGGREFWPELLMWALPDLRLDTIEFVWSDLHALGLLPTPIDKPGATLVGTPPARPLGPGETDPRTLEAQPKFTNLGSRLLAFIREPPPVPTPPDQAGA